MRRKSERKSSDASSSAPVRRTSRRSKKSPLLRPNESNKFELKDAISEKSAEKKQLSHCNESENNSIDKNIDELAVEGNKTDKLFQENTAIETKCVLTNENDEKAEQIFQSQIEDTKPFVFSGSLNIDSFSKSEKYKQNYVKKADTEETPSPINASSIAIESQKQDHADVQNKSCEISNKKQNSDSVSRSFGTESATSERIDAQRKIVSTKKRKWLSKNSKEIKAQIMSISTDSLKNLISDVHPVPLSDIKLESSSEVEETFSERNQEINNFIPGQHGNQRDRECEAKYIDESQVNLNKKKNREAEINDLKVDSHLSLSPPKNQPSTVLFITNLVRPFTILQLKGLLARTGQITSGGFWIDRIKSKCYVRYETEDEAIETRHALHGVRWPASNPKCLNVDFGDIMSLEKAITSCCHETPKFGQDSHSENRIIGTGWDIEFKEEKKQMSRPVREWDVGKKEDFGKDIDNGKDREKSRIFEREKNREEKTKRRSLGKAKYCCSLSPDSKKLKKKENDPPLRLLDDLFRKTIVTPCIYWLPLTPEQIAEKETFRLRRITEHRERIKQRELEREKITAREKERANEKDRQKERDKEKEKRRDHSEERRNSHSRDRRRY